MPTEPVKDMLDGYEPNHLYKHDFRNGIGSYFTVVHQDESGVEINLSNKISLKVTYIRETDTINRFEVVKLKEGRQEEKLNLSVKNLDQLSRIVSFLETVDFKIITERRTKLVLQEAVQNVTYELLKSFVVNENGDGVIGQLLADGHLSSHDLVNTGYRRKQLEVFWKLLNEIDYYKEYGTNNGITDLKEEKIWQYFFEKNKWIFGYGMDYRFKSILQREAHISDSDLQGSNTVITDYLMGDRFFTTFVEIKKPSTRIFGIRKNRSNCWSLSDDLICAVSQILEHKAAGQLKFEKPQYINGNLTNLKAYDSKVVLLIGKWSELDSAQHDQEREIKKKTFELYRRDSRNIEMLTYDELYDRAQFIVEGDVSEDKPEQELDDSDDLPF